MKFENIKISSPKVLQGGIYSIQEAALYSKVPTKTLKQWYLGDKNVHRVFNNIQMIENGEYMSFLDFVQGLGIRELRMEHNISLSKIREAIKVALNQYGITHLFAKEHKIMVDKNTIIIKVDNNWIQLNSPHVNQITLPIVEQYLRKLKFNELGYATQYRPFTGILQDPFCQLGEPIVEGSGVTALALYDSLAAEQSYQTVADLYGVEVGDVKVAENYFKYLGKAA